MKKPRALTVSISLMILSTFLWVLTEGDTSRQIYTPIQPILLSFLAKAIFLQLFWFSAYSICETVDLKFQLPEKKWGNRLTTWIILSWVSVAGLYFFSQDTTMILYCVLSYLGVLLYLWPLRFLAMGEATFAFLFGTFYLSSNCQLVFPSEQFSFWAHPILIQAFHDSQTVWSENLLNAPPDLQTLKIMACFFPFLLFFLQIMRKMAFYHRHLSVQQYSLPVFIGWALPFSRNFLWNMSKEKPQIYNQIAIWTSFFFWMFFLFSIFFSHL